MRTPHRLPLALAACIAVGGAAMADDATMDHSKHETAMSSAASSAQGSQELHKAMMPGMQQMQQMKMSGDPDRDFASMMIEHHQQAIAMAQVELKNGKNAEVRKKAQDIIDSSQRDIATLKKWSNEKQ